MPVGRWQLEVRLTSHRTDRSPLMVIRQNSDSFKCACQRDHSRRSTTTTKTICGRSSAGAVLVVCPRPEQLLKTPGAERSRSFRNFIIFPNTQRTLRRHCGATIPVLQSQEKRDGREEIRLTQLLGQPAFKTQPTLTIFLLHSSTAWLQNPKLHVEVARPGPMSSTKQIDLPLSPVPLVQFLQS